MRLKLMRRPARQLLALMVLLLCFSPAALAETETETQTQTQTQTTSTFSGVQGSLSFSMVPYPVPGNTSYPRGSGSAEVQAEGTLVSVHFQAEGMARSARLTLVVTADGAAHSVTNMTTSYDGEVEAEGAVSLGAGSHSIGLEVLDTSTFSSPTEVMVSSPATQALSLPQGEQASASTTGAQTQSVTTVPEGDTEDEGIRTAIQTKIIPAVVEVGESGSVVHVNDGNFSVSIGRYQDAGYLVSVSAANVTGPRVLVLNLTSSQVRTRFSGTLLVTLDGSTVAPASSLSQVLGAKAGDPASFVLVSDPSALSLLILIPHFSYHVIEIVPVLAQAGAVLLVYLPAALFGVAVVTAFVAAAYARRTRVGVRATPRR